MGNVIFSELQFHQLQQVVYCSNIVGKGDLKNINIGEKQKASHSKNDLLNGGGEGEIHINILLGYWYRMVANPLYLWAFSINS